SRNGPEPDRGLVAETPHSALCQCDPADASPSRCHDHNYRFCHSPAGKTNAGTGTKCAQRLAGHSHSHRIGHSKLPGRSRGVAINGVITGLSIGVLLWLIGVQPALMFGVFAFLGEFLPNIGAFLVSIPILLVALSLGATKFWLALGVIVLVYQVELNVLVPGVLGKEMRLHPVNILFFTLATATMFGLLGVFLAVPAAALVQIVIDEFY